MKYALLLIFFGLFAEARVPLVLTIGSQIELDTLGHGVSLTNSDIVKVKSFNSRIKIFPQKIGSTQIQYHNEIINILVIPQEQKQPASRFLKRIASFKNLKIEVENGKLIVIGKISRASEYFSLIETKFKFWLLESEFEPRLLNAIQLEIKARLERLGFKDLNLIFSPRYRCYLDKKTSTNIQLIEDLSTFGFETLVSEEVSPIIPMVRVRMWLTEIKKSHLKEIGVGLPNTFTKSKLEPETIVRFLEQSGEGHVLASPILLSRSGENAEFFAGGEIPIKVSSARTAEVIWKKYGILMKTKTTVDNFKHIQMDFETEVSSLDGDTSIDGIPGIFTTKVNSKINLAEQKSVVISGLLKRINSQSAKGFPFLSRIPILGDLFSSHSYLNSESELVIFVKPEVTHE